MKRELLPHQIILAVTTGSIAGIVTVLGELRDQFGFSEASIGVIVASGFFASFVAQAGFSRYADGGYAKEMATIGMVVSAGALLVMVFAESVIVWSASRAVLGFAGGLVIPGLRRAATVLDPDNVGENLGRLLIGDVTGFVLGPVAAAAFVAIGGIRAPFLALAIASVLFIPFVLRLPPDTGAKDKGSGLPLDLLRLQRLQGALILVFGYFVLIGAFEAVLPVQLEDRGASTTFIGIAFTAFATPIVFVSRRAGRLADQVGPPKVGVTGMAITACIAIVFGMIGALWAVVFALVLAGFTDGFGFIGAQVTVSRAVPEERQAGALGLMGAAGVLGAGVAAFPSAWLYGRVGAAGAWQVIGTTSLGLILIGALRMRGTTPASAPATTSSR